jgi:hypothetical protein
MMLMTDPQPSGAFTWTQEPWGRALRCTALAAPHLFTTRDVNLRDDPQEWDAVASSLSVSRDRLRLIRQVHGTAVAIAKRQRQLTWDLPEADIIVSDDPDVAIGVRVADCAPVLLFDRKQGIENRVSPARPMPDGEAPLGRPQSAPCARCTRRSAPTRRRSSPRSAHAWVRVVVKSDQTCSTRSGRAEPTRHHSNDGSGPQAVTGCSWICRGRIAIS